MNNNILLFIVFFLLIFIFLKFFNINNIFKNILFLFHNTEYFENKLVPNKIFRHNNKIYLLDTKNILEDNKNPLIFDSFKEYQEFIANLENDLENDFQLIKNIKNEKNIKELKPPKNLKNNDDIIKENNCSKFASECSLKESSPYIEKIYNKKQLEEIGIKCNKPILKKEFCSELENLYKNGKKYKKMCNDDPNNIICKKLNLINHDTRNLSDLCLNNKKDYDSFKKLCLLEDFFKENMLLYDF